MSLIKFSQLLSESGDLQLLHTAANIPAPKIHKTEDGSHVAVHSPSTKEHAEWLKGKFDKALKHNPSQRHIKVELKHHDDKHEVHVTHTPPKKVNEDVIDTENAQNNLQEASRIFNKGDHVHLHSAGTQWRPGNVLKHGVVKKTSDRTAEVDWEDGTNSKHLHSSGRKVGEHNDSYATAIRHNVVHDPSKGIGVTKKLTNDEHKDHLKQISDKKQADSQHQSSHQDAISRLSSMHHSELKPHHLAAIHDILTRAKSGHD
jgi:hypothetical protein